MLTLNLVLLVCTRIINFRQYFKSERMMFSITDSVNISNNNRNITNKEYNSSVWKQLLFTLLASLPYFTHGVETSALTVTDHSGHFIPSTGQVPWTTTALFLASIASAPVYWYLLDKWGRKSGVYLVNLSQAASCIPLFLPETDVTVIILHVLAGITTCGLYIVLPTYIREINNDRLRGFSLSLMMPAMATGYMMFLVLDLESMMFLMVGLVAAQFLAILVLVETPSYLVMAGKIESAKTSVAKLKCTTLTDEVVSREVNLLQDESERAKANGKLTLWRILKNPIYRDIIKIGLVVNTSMVLCGSIVFLDQEKTLIQMKMAIASEKLLVLGCFLAGSLATWAVIYFVDRKTILSFSFSVMVLSMGLLSVFTQADLTVTNLRWLPVVSLAVLVFGYGTAWGLKTIVMAEILNFEIRASVLTIIFIYAQIIRLAHVYTFKYIEDYVGVYTLLYIFTIVNMFGGIYCLFALPDIRNKTMRQVERQMKRVPLLKFNVNKIEVK